MMNHQSGSSAHIEVREGQMAIDPEGIDLLVLNKGSDDQLECIGYRDHVCKKLLFYILVFLSLGFLLLVVYWKPEWKVRLTKVRCSLRQADIVMLQDSFHQMWPETIQISEIQDGLAGDAYLVSDGPSDDDTAVLTLKQNAYIRYFDHKHVRYMWDKNQKCFKQLRGLDDGFTCAVIHDKFAQGLGEVEAAYKKQLHGENVVGIEVKSYFKLFFEEVLNPFYIFQIASIILWSVDDYYIYASCIFLISSISLAVELYEIRKQSETLRDMVSTAEHTMEVIRQGLGVIEMPTSCLVPGDVIVVPARGCMMTCDAVLLSGNAIVNESMLTGESVPVTKTPLAQSEAEEEYSPDIHKRHTIFSGTQVIQTRFYGDQKVKAVVVRTGFSTAKGELVRSILYPKPMGFKFYQDAMKFIFMLAFFALVGMTYTIVQLVREGSATKKVILRALDIITIVVPPALPAAMTVGTVYAQNRLKKQNIFCISPQRINMCGKLKCICFDKTGTLTEEGLDMWGVVPMEQSGLQAPAHFPSDLQTKSPLMVAMATCHSLTWIDGEITGDPLDLKMFEFTNWSFEEPGDDTTRYDSLIPAMVRPPADSDGKLMENTEILDIQAEMPYEVGIVRQFTFSSSLQRMSVITRVLGADHMDVYAKGAPEKIASLCRPETLPANFHDKLHKYTVRGFRVIGLAWKPLDSKVTWHQAQRIKRDTVECDLQFVGLLVMENTLKPETTPVIRELRDADIRTVMVTGDNILTAVSVARQCAMIEPKDPVIMVNVHPPDSDKPARVEWEYADLDVSEDVAERTQDVANVAAAEANELYQAVTIDQLEDKEHYHFAMTGRSFAALRTYFPELVNKVMIRGTVFARMGPDQKSQLVEHLQALGYGVGMCGDGANDCGALKTANAGISLSEAEASVASPFTSKVANITCVPTVIKEGRAALVTSFGVFKYMALYSMIQFVTVLILYTKTTNLGDWMFLYIDLVITTTVAILMGHTGAYDVLVPRRPPGSLIGPSNIFSILLHICTVIGFQAGTYFLVANQAWFEPVPFEPQADNNVVSYETTTLFYVSSFQYLILAFAFSRGPPYRKPIWTNVLFLISLIVLSGLTILLVLYPFQFLVNILQLKVIPSMRFRLILLGYIFINFLVVVIFEKFIVPSRTLAKLTNKLRGKKTFKNKYKLIRKEVEESYPHWPPIGQVTTATVAMGNNGILGASNKGER